MQSPIFKRGQAVKFQTPSRPKGKGVVTQVTKTEKGVWYTVLASGGMSVKLRAASLQAGFSCLGFMVALALVGTSLGAVAAKHPKADKPTATAKADKSSFGARMAAARAAKHATTKH
jgi:hypothetical protein